MTVFSVATPALICLTDCVCEARGSDLMQFGGIMEEEEEEDETGSL